MIKKGDFIELDYTAKIMDGDQIFDTTRPEDAEKAGFICDHNHNHNHEHEHNHKHATKEDFKPIIICVGERHLLPGLDDALEGATLGEHDIMLEEDSAFGKKSAKLLKLIPISKFKEQKINPYPGLVLDIDESRGTIKTVSGGRVVVDFNHPLAGKKVKYEVSIKRKIDTDKEKIQSILNMLRIPYEEIITGKENKILVNEKFPVEALKPITEEIERVTKIKVSFDKKTKEQKTETPKKEQDLNK